MAPTPAQSLYSRKATLYQRFFVDGLKWETVLETFFQENLALHPGMRILDAGCGTGSVTLAIHALASREKIGGMVFHAFDLTCAMLDIFRQRAMEKDWENIQFQQADVLDLENQLPSDWNQYNTIVSSAMLEYIPKTSLSQALKNLKHLLQPNGTLILFATRRTWITKMAGQLWWGTNLFDPGGLEDAVHGVGFTRVQFKKLPRGWDAFMLAAVASVGEP